MNTHKKDIIDWNISVTWDNGEKENITTIPQNLTDAVHELIESLEVDLAEKRLAFLEECNDSGRNEYKLTLTTKEKDVLYNLIFNPNILIHPQGEVDWNEKEFQKLSYKIKKLIREV